MAQQQYPGEVDIYDPLPTLGVDFQSLHWLGDAGIVDQNINATKLSDNRLDSTFAGFGIGDITAEANMTSPQGRGRLMRCIQVKVENGNACAMRRHQLRGGQTNATTAGGT